VTKILVIAEDRAAIATIKAALVTEKVDWVVVDNPDEGAIAAQTQLPDLLLYSVQTSYDAGLTCLEKMRAHSETVTIPFIFLLPETTPATAHRHCMNAGADDCLVMPYSNAEMLTAIKGRLQQHQREEAYLVQRLEQLRHNLAVAIPHELHTPLQGIITSAELLSGYWNTLDEDDIIEITENIILSAKRLHELIQKFLLFTQLDLVVNEPNDFRHWYVGTTQQGKPFLTALATKVAAQYHRSENLGLNACAAAIAVPEKWLKILVEELVDNAFKFSEGHDQRDHSEVRIVSKVQDDQWKLQIRDYGRGMTPEQVRQIGAYMQFDRSQYEQQGAGLGLAIAERIVKIYNGAMTIDSKLNQGTMVTVFLPLGNEDDDALIIG
jgi:signal transduction histidine kinase